MFMHILQKNLSLFTYHSDRRFDGHFPQFCEEKCLKHNFSVQLFRGRL